jgi:hypothetical protein
MAQELAFRVVLVLALAMVMLVVMTLAAPPRTANDTAPPSEAIYRPQHRLQPLKLMQLAGACHQHRLAGAPPKARKPAGYCFWQGGALSPRIS